MRGRREGRWELPSALCLPACSFSRSDRKLVWEEEEEGEEQQWDGKREDGWWGKGEGGLFKEEVGSKGDAWTDCFEGGGGGCFKGGGERRRKIRYFLRAAAKREEGGRRAES